ncbi:phytanoyl-CoA dioxygenase family protein [Pseudoalteromonas luteoviolacea]|uniref:Phytanoyl-CoA dioxygenase n=1 Tax=Pseudoalteromonas luteoviolacea S4060-1 TaxID=1365257 RepID=A0A167MEH9_9GAMM|nr:phytanoyl-CoA dioxygenase family protein [Pseudoalteromonas luteoviolacea]KZN66261.1 hypothetical protein N478_20305 [Pseudoalteromonas luteoviolacea S4060-1]
MSLKQKLDKDGVILVKNVFSVDEIDKIRKDLRAYFEEKWIEHDFGKVQNNASVNCKFLEDVLAHPNMVSVMKEISGDDALFTGNCDIHQNKMGNWHKDGGFFGKDPFGENYTPVYKVGIYLQDQQNPKRGFQYKPGSHKVDNLTDGEHQAMTSAIGDILIFDLRITHSGMLPTLFEKIFYPIFRVISAVKIAKPIGRYFKNLVWKLFGVKNRECIFFVFGPNHFETESFAQKIVTAQTKSPSHQAKLNPSLIEKFEKQNMGICQAVMPEK